MKKANTFQKKISRREKDTGIKKKQFGTWTMRMLEKDSRNMQKLLVALSRFSLSEIQEIRRKKSSYGFKKEADKMTVYSANTKDFDYAMSIAPKTFFLKRNARTDKTANKKSIKSYESNG